MPSESESGRRVDADASNAPFRFAFGGYVGVLLASVAAMLLADADVTRAVGGTLAAAIVGALGGIGLAQARPELPVHIGRTRLSRNLPYLPFACFGIVAGYAWIGSTESTVVLAAATSTFAGATVGYGVRVLAYNRYVDAATGDEPIATWQWEPPGSSSLSGLVFVLWLGLAVLNAITGDWTTAVMWTGLGAFWGLTTVVEGRVRVGKYVSPTELEVQDTGLVIRRPYARSLLPWTEINHVRLREGELVIDHGLFDVRFDREGFEDPDAALEAIERTGFVVAIR